MWHKAEWIGHPMRIELTRVGLLVYLANRYTTKGAHMLTENNNARLHVDRITMLDYMLPG